MSLEGKVVLITGGSRGIGRAISLRLAQERPRHIAIAYCLDHESAESALQELKKLGVAASAHATDVSQVELQEKLFKQLGNRHGRLDIFVANAARASFQPACQISPRNWQKIMDLNARAFLSGCQMAAALMRQSGGGRIIGLSSLGSRYYLPGYAALGAAKAAIESLARYLAVELAPFNINVNVVCGGLIETDGTRLMPNFKKVAQRVAALCPAGRIGQPEDIAGVVAFLCSPESDWIRGQVVLADGGYSLTSAGGTEWDP